MKPRTSLNTSSTAPAFKQWLRNSESDAIMKIVLPANG
jgi:hypothetical protein